MSWGGATVFVQRRDGEDEQRAPFLERVGRERWGDVDG